MSYLIEWFDSLCLRIFVALGLRWFPNVAFSESGKTGRVAHMIFAQDEKWLDQTIKLIEKAQSEKEKKKCS